MSLPLLNTFQSQLDQLRSLDQHIQALSESEAGMRLLEVAILEAHQLGQSLVANGLDPDDYYRNHLLRTMFNDSKAIRLYWIYGLGTQKSRLFFLCQRLALANIRGLLVCFDPGL